MSNRPVPERSKKNWFGTSTAADHRITSVIIPVPPFTIWSCCLAQSSTWRLLMSARSQKTTTCIQQCLASLDIRTLHRHIIYKAKAEMKLRLRIHWSRSQSFRNHPYLASNPDISSSGLSNSDQSLPSRISTLKWTQLAPRLD